MKRTLQPLWTRVRKNLRSRLVSGTVVLVPVFITIAVLRWVFLWLAGFLSPVVKRLVVQEELAAWMGQGAAEQLTRYAWIIVPIVALLLLVVLIYVVGILVRLVVGRKIIGIGESLLLRLPLVRPIYSAAKQVVEAVSLPDRSAFKAVVLAHFPSPRMWAIGFLTGIITDQNGKILCKVFIPTTPNPTTGFYELAEPEDLLLTDITVDSAFRMVISGGIIAPERYNATPLDIGMLIKPALAPANPPSQTQEI